MCFFPRARLALRPGSGAGREGRSQGPPSCPLRAAGPSPGLGRFQDADSALAAHLRGLGRVPAAPQSRAHSLIRVRLRRAAGAGSGPRGPQGPLQAGGARPGAAGPGAEGGSARTRLSGIGCNRWGRPGAANGRSSPPLLFPRSISSLLVVLRLAGHGSAGRQVGAAAAPRVQLQLRGVAAGLQRARLPAAVRAAPAGAQDAAGEPGQGLQVAAAAGGARGSVKPGIRARRPAGVPGGGVWDAAPPCRVDPASVSSRTLAFPLGGWLYHSRPESTLVSETHLWRGCVRGAASPFPLLRVPGVRLGVQRVPTAFL